MMERAQFNRIVAERYRGATVMRAVTVMLPMGLRLHAAVLEDQHGRFTVATQEQNGVVDVVRVSEGYIREAITMYQTAINTCEEFIRDMDVPVKPGGAVEAWTYA